jgi:dienelactone hydrolase
MDVKISLKGAALEGELEIPENAVALVIFVHGSGSSRHSPRNQMVAKYLRERGNLATLLVDLLTQREDETDEKIRFNIEFLSQRIRGITDWVRQNPTTAELKLGYFGASTGAAAALETASQRTDIDAIVSRGGRPDLAGKALNHVTAPTLLIVGGNDEGVLELNQAALEVLQTTKDIVIIPGASHLFEETGALEAVANFAQKWFSRFLS